MTQPINPNTNIPMSLRVEKIQHMKQLQSGQQQSTINQHMEVENELKQHRVNENNKAEQDKIRDKEKEEQSSKEKEDNRDSESNEKKEQKLQKMNGSKGSIVDVKV